MATNSVVLPGRPAYITNGLDKQGLLCGTTQTVNGTFVDLRNYKYLYYTDPFRLFSSIEVDYAPSMCVASCPGDADACQLSALPCTSNNQYRYARMQLKLAIWHLVELWAPDKGEHHELQATGHM